MAGEPSCYDIDESKATRSTCQPRAARAWLAPYCTSALPKRRIRDSRHAANTTICLLASINNSILNHLAQRSHRRAIGAAIRGKVLYCSEARYNREFGRMRLSLLDTKVRAFVLFRESFDVSATLLNRPTSPGADTRGVAAHGEYR